MHTKSEKNINILFCRFSLIKMEINAYLTSILVVSHLFKKKNASSKHFSGDLISRYFLSRKYRENKSLTKKVDLQ